MSSHSLYQQKRTSAQEAVRLVRNGDFIIVPIGVAEPPSLLTALSEQRHDQGLELRPQRFVVSGETVLRGASTESS